MPIICRVLWLEEREGITLLQDEAEQDSKGLAQGHKRLFWGRRCGMEEHLRWLLEDSRISATEPQGFLQFTGLPDASTPPEPPGLLSGWLG
uniref:Uncharacterized protein n=1 Tax=Thermogemmatispora argillosa TaxID=2045280 RepID=A0A455SYV1_9CHLR|nr:hypothetical protein KTA_02610 [Thermogemmatispora argillosa]